MASASSERIRTMNEQKQFEQLIRPQTPLSPFPYNQEEVWYENKSAGVTLAGTLTLPNAHSPFPTVVLIAGMGPNDRDYTMMGHKMFLIIADYLTRHGFAVLRYDKRGVGKSTGEFTLALTSQDFAEDVIAGINYLKTRKDINPNRIGLLGHSEGGMIASMVAAKSNHAAFVVSLAGACLTSPESIIKHNTLQLQADGASRELIIHNSNLLQKILATILKEADLIAAEVQLQDLAADYFNELPAALHTESAQLLFAFSKIKADGRIKMMNSPWYRFFLNHNHLAILRQIQIPVLALNGDCDYIASSKLILPVMAQAFKDAGNEHVILELPKLNHWFQTCETGAMTEYAQIEETISPTVLTLITDWITQIKSTK